MAKSNATVDTKEFRFDLPANQVIAIRSILAGDSFRDAALKAGVDERTLRRWRQRDAKFEATLRRSVLELQEDLCMQTVTSAQKALETLRSIAGDVSHPRAFQAACHLLSMAKINASLNPRVTEGEVFCDQLQAWA